MPRIVASRVPELLTAFSGAFMALIRLALRASYHVRRGPARRLRAEGCPQQFTAVHAPVRKPVEPRPSGLRSRPGVFQECREREGAMSLPTDRLSTPLPKRFPVGARYVVEGRGGENGLVGVVSRSGGWRGGGRVN